MLAQGHLGRTLRWVETVGIPSWCGETIVHRVSAPFCLARAGFAHAAASSVSCHHVEQATLHTRTAYSTATYAHPRTASHRSRCYARPQWAAPLRGTSHMKQRKQWLEVTPGGQVSNFAAPPIRCPSGYLIVASGFIWLSGWLWLKLALTSFCFVLSAALPVRFSFAKAIACLLDFSPGFDVTSKLAKLISERMITDFACFIGELAGVVFHMLNHVTILNTRRKLESVS